MHQYPQVLLQVMGTMVPAAAAYAVSAICQSGAIWLAILIAARFLDAVQFAKFAYVHAWVMAIAMIADLGLTQAGLRSYARTKDPDNLRMVVTAKLCISLVALPVGALLWKCDESAAIVIWGATLASLILSVRIFHVHAGRFRNLAAASVVMLLVTAVGLFAAAVQGMWLPVAIAVFVVPQVAALILGAGISGSVLPLHKWRVVDRDILRFAPYLFVSGVLFSMLQPAALIVARGHLGASEFAALALAFSIAGAAGMLVTAFRSSGYATFATGAEAVDAPLTGQIWQFIRLARPFVAAYGTASGCAIVLAALAYEPKLPGATAVVSTLLAGFAISSLVGLFNIRYQVLGYRRLEIVVNAARLSLGITVAATVARTGLQVAQIVATVFAVGEVAYMLIGNRHRKRLKAQGVVA